MNSLVSGKPPDSPDAMRLAMAGSIGIWIYMRRPGSCFKWLTGHTEAFSSVAYSHNGRRIASGSADGTVLLWDLAPDTSDER